MDRAIVSAFVSFAILIGCNAEETTDQPEILGVVGEAAPAGERPRGIYVRIERPERTPEQMLAARAPRARIIYMNRVGGTFTPGNDDSATNRSSIPYSTSSISPWGVSEAGWREVMDCMTELWAPFDVEITDVEPPASVDYIESVVAGRPQDVGMGSGVGGVSPFDCGVIERSIVFTFAEVYGTSYRDICETAAQETAHSFGLDHEHMCEDPMTYLYGCGEKAFRDVDAPCGEYSNRTCSCGGSTQNSVRLLTEFNGPADGTAPTVTIAEPADGSTVAPGFGVQVEAVDNVGVKRVELYLDGQLTDTLTTAPWSFDTAADLPDGDYAIKTVAYDSKNSGFAEITVHVDKNGPDDGDPPGDDDDDDDDDDTPGGGDDGANNVVGGCAVTPAGGASGSAWLLLGLALVVVLRRK